MTKALTYEEIRRRVQAHGFELLTTEKEHQRQPSKHILVRSPGGYVQVRRVDAFAPGAVQVTCQFDRPIRKGETLAVMAASLLTGTVLHREYTPPVLKETGYRLDGWAELQGPNGQAVFLALEHQGGHRHDPRAPVHRKRGDPEASMRKQALQDKDKAERLAKDTRIVLVTVPDILLATDRERGVIEIVANALEGQMKWLKGDSGYLARKAHIMSRLDADERVLTIPATWIQDARQRVEEALQNSGDDERISFVEAHPLVRKVTLACKTHGILRPVNINNVLGSKDGTRKGTRCAQCANEDNGHRRRLPFREVELAARLAGFSPLFQESEYVNNQINMKWQCLRDPSHIAHDTLSHIVERGCSQCRAEGRGEERRATEFAEVSRLIEERGDQIASTSVEYRDQDSRIRYRCSLCGGDASQLAVKIKVGQRHGCQRHTSSKATRRRREFERLQEIVKVLDLELVTTAETYLGNRGAVIYRRRGSAEWLSAPAYRLRQWAKRARSQSA